LLNYKNSLGLNYKCSLMKSLTKAEEQIMKVLWKLGSGLLMEIVEHMPKPQPHKNTVATVLKTMVDKGFVETENVGRFFRYRPVITKEEYSTSTLVNVAKGYFEGSFTNVVSFLVDENKLSVKDLELLLQQIKKTKK
jgi:BlaI family transcriptional regulator, penicillinase repressor